jgi:hypothetical protein
MPPRAIGIGVLFLAVAVCGPARAASSPEDPTPEPRPNAVQLDLGLAVIGLAYERILHPRFAVQLEAQIFGTWFGPIVDLPNMRGFGGQIRPSFFLTDDAPRGVYVAPFTRVDRVSSTATDANASTGSAVGFSSGVFAGYSFLFAERVNLRIGTGLQYMSYVVDAGGNRIAFKTFFPALDLVVGYQF